MSRRRQLLLLAAVVVALAIPACGKRKPVVEPLRPDAHVLALGDSLTFGFGAPPDAAWPAQLAQRTGWQVSNAGVNGDTSAGALRRLEGLLEARRYDAILVGIGGNDMLRGVSPQATQDNLAAIVRQAMAHTPYVAIIATPEPKALAAAVGALSDADFYETVATAEQALLLPKVYSRVLSDAALRSDRIHANAKGYAAMAEQLARQLEEAGWR